MEFRILGPLEVLEKSHQVPLGGSKQRALLASLLLHANEVVSRDRLIDELWGASPPDTAPTALQVYVSQLRKVLGQIPGLLFPEHEAHDVLRAMRQIVVGDVDDREPRFGKPGAAWQWRRRWHGRASRPL